ncbi:hypothetical protein TAO_1420 [Candidatus Nitrosoglobus terrae]|uniref:Uncharacterized protein n=1 Tax=Candidatus Nitrosoglobus terrae TaxID=1630141 RepID=A0A1Q2SNT3_9GAMM|nr:hypothetical protein TAO_1420 [Candidatus Nitrosoglobus terrae]
MEQVGFPIANYSTSRKAIKELINPMIYSSVATPLDYCKNNEAHFELIMNAFKTALPKVSFFLELMKGSIKFRKAVRQWTRPDGFVASSLG